MVSGGTELIDLFKFTQHYKRSLESVLYLRAIESPYFSLELIEFTANFAML